MPAITIKNREQTPTPQRSDLTGAALNDGLTITQIYNILVNNSSFQSLAFAYTSASTNTQQAVAMSANPRIALRSIQATRCSDSGLKAALSRAGVKLA